MQINSLRSLNRDTAARELKSALTGWLPYSASVVLGLLSVYTLALLTWQFVPHASPGAPLTEPNTRQARSTRTQATPGVAINKGVGTHLFGVPETHKPASKAAAMNAPETDLDITLRGLFTANHPKNSYAIIAVSGGNDKRYGIGAQLPGGAKVRAIYADRVILNRNGQLEALKLPQDQQKGSISTASQHHNASRTSLPQPQSAAPRSINTQSVAQTVKHQPRKLLQVVRPAPVTKNGSLIGYRVYPGQDSKAFTALGLKSGDIIKSINGIALDDPKQSIQILQQLSTASQLNATIERKGEQRSLTLSLNAQ